MHMFTTDAVPIPGRAPTSAWLVFATESSPEEALEELRAQAEARGGDGIVGLRIFATPFGFGAYGTAVAHM